MKILVVGSGGREHALCWKLAQSPHRPALYCAPGNAGTEGLARNVPITAEDLDGLLTLAKTEAIDLTVVGPEDALCAGIVDRFTKARQRIFGPTAAAARLEGDKAFAKQLMRQAGVPTAEARYFGPTDMELAQARQRGNDRDEALSAKIVRGYDQARQYIVTRDEGVAVKACGLAKGKGVFIHPDPAEALSTIEDLMVRKTLGEAGERILVEELLHGAEVSVMAFVDGRNIYVMEAAADHKRLGDGDSGPNTGGMGAYSPAAGLSDAAMAMIQRDVFVPIIDALRREEIEYRGVLYAGIMMTAGGPKVLEYNCRFGDPETQPTLMRLRGDLVDVLLAAIEGRLDQVELDWDQRPAVCVVMCSAGYPGSCEKGKIIEGLEAAAKLPDVQVFHAGTQRAGGRVVTAGGRVLGVTALGDTLEQARQRAYQAADNIAFEGATFRRDIGLRGDAAAAARSAR